MFAGPNGSGKSTIKSVIAPSLLGVYINPDDIEKDIRRFNVLDLSAYGVCSTAETIRSFFARSSLLRRAGLLDEATALRFNDNKLIFHNVEVNAYFAAVAADFLRQSLLAAGVSFTRNDSVEPGLEALELWVGGVQLQRVEVDVVGPEKVAAIDLIHRKGASTAEGEGDWLVVAQAYDVLRDPIYGVGFGWDIEGHTFDQAGDVLIYAHDPERDSLKLVTAWAAGIEASMSVYASDAEVFTSNDDAFNCSVDGGRGAPLWALLLLLGIGRRRRR